MTHCINRMGLRALILLLGVSPSTLAFAQVADDDSPDTQIVTLDEIIITARKVEESILDAPISVSVFTDEQIRDAGLTSIEDIGAFTPGLVFPREFGRRFDRPVIRGMSNILGTANASVFIDGIFQRGSAQIFDLSNVERLEVIKGPQSALYGRQTFSGAINYITRDPENEFRARVRSTAAERGEYEVNGFAGGALIEDKLLAEVSGRFFTYGGDRRNQVTGVRLGQQESFDAALKVIAMPTDWLRSEARLVYAEQDDNLPETPFQPSSFNNVFLDTSQQYFEGVVPVREEFLALTTDPIDGGGTARDVFSISLINEIDINGYALTTTTAYSDEDTRDNLDLDLQAPSLLGGFLEQQQTTDYQTFSQEVRLDSPRDKAFRWRIGGYIYDETFNEQAFIPSFGSRTSFDRPIQNIAAFGSLEYDFSDTVSATAELRVAEDTLGFENEALNIDLEESFSSVTPRFTLDWRASDDLLVYAIAARGNKPGGFSNNPERLLAVLTPSELAFDEEALWSYEGGIKSSLLDGRAQVEAAVYYTDWTDQQLTITEPGTAGASRVVNAGASEVLGAEFSARLAVTNNWQLNGTLSLQDAELLEFDDFTTQLILFGDPSAAGNKLPNVPSYEGSISSSYTMPRAIGDYDLLLRADALFEGSKYAQIHNLAETGNKERVNLRAGLRGDSVAITLFVNNLFDDNTAVSVVRYTDFTTFRRAFQTTAPKARQIGITLEYNFD